MDEGIKAQGQMRGITDGGNLKNIRTDEQGRMLVNVDGQTQTSKEKVLASASIKAGTEATTIDVNGKVTTALVANYSETATITVAVDGENIVVDSSIAIELPINKEVTSLEIISNETDTKVYYLLKGIK